VHPSTYREFSPARDAVYAYKLRMRRRRLLLRAWRKRGELESVCDRTQSIHSTDILAASTIRNEMERLPYFLSHYRGLGVQHFLFVDNGSTDGSREYLQKQPDVSLWSTLNGYKASRFGMDWLTFLQMRYAHGHWCLTVDADEILIYPEHDHHSLKDLTSWLDQCGVPFFATMMLDMYPKGKLGEGCYEPGSDPIEALPWFSGHDYSWEWRPKNRNMSIRGGPRKRVFFTQNPDFTPHLNKTPLIRWSRRYVYFSSTHTVLPRRLNAGFDLRNNLPSGVLLHTKFLDSVIEKSREEKIRKEHFTYRERYDEYYDEIIAQPTLWDEHSLRYTGWKQLCDLGLMRSGDWC